MKCQGGDMINIVLKENTPCIFVEESNIRCIQSRRILGENKRWCSSLFDNLHLKIQGI